MFEAHPDHTRRAVSVDPASMRSAAERNLGIVLSPIREDDILLSAQEQRRITSKLERNGSSVLEIKPGQDLGYIARACRFEDQTPCLAGCATPEGASHFAGQRFAYHAVNALQYNLRCSRWVNTPTHRLAEESTNAFFMGLTPTEISTGDPITKYAGDGFTRDLAQSGIPISKRMSELDATPLLVAVDLTGYALLNNRLGLPFIKKIDEWCLIAACPPPRQFIHILGRAHTTGLPPADL